MQKVAISAAIGAGAAVALALVLGSAARSHVIGDGELGAMTGLLAFGMGVALFALFAFNNRGKLTPSKLRETKLADLPAPKDSTDRPLVWGIPHMPESLKIVVKPTTMPDGILHDIDKYKDQEVLVTIRKSTSDADFNPIHLHAIFKKLKQNGNSFSALLRDEHGDFAGYIPGNAVRRFVDGPNAESEITKKIIEALKNPENGAILRDVRGMAASHTISDQASVEEAARRITQQQLEGLVILKNGRHRNPVAAVYLDDLAAATIRLAD
jgi:hypothetical protein